MSIPAEAGANQPGVFLERQLEQTIVESKVRLRKLQPFIEEAKLIEEGLKDVEKTLERIRERRFKHQRSKSVPSATPKRNTRGDMRKRVLEAMKDGEIHGPSEIADEIGSTGAYVSQILKTLTEQKSPEVTKVGRGQFRLVATPETVTDSMAQQNGHDAPVAGIVQ